MISIILSFGLGTVFSFCIIGILAAYYTKKYNINTEKIVTAKIETDNELPDFIKNMIDGEVKKRWNDVRAKYGLSSSVNVYKDYKRKLIYLNESDWNKISKTLTRISGVQEINCMPTKDSIN